MKELLLLIAMIGFVSCESETEIAIRTKVTVFYFKDSATNLCFARAISVVKGGPVNSITCVPCDSVKNVLK